VDIGHRSLIPVLVSTGRCVTGKHILPRLSRKQ
jgi:hypothetical protein